MEISVILDSMFNMKSQIKIFETGIQDGIVSRNKKFYNNIENQEKINDIFLKVRQEIGRKIGFKGEKMFQASQKTSQNNDLYPDGKYIVITEENMMQEDYWYEQLPADILIISNKYKNIVVGNQMADCPVLIVEDRKLGVTALSHCGASYIDRYLPVDTIKALQKEYSSQLEDIYVYIGSCIKKDSYTYDCYPKWATNKDVWKEAITKKNDIYYIDLIKAITNQLNNIGIKNIEISPYDTATNPRFYSNAAASKGKKEKFGQNFVGFFYK